VVKAGTREDPVIKGTVGKNILFSSSDESVAVTVTGYGYKEVVT
jgi:pyrimidine operon attenuation protein/uracil phosphoribosyltransferase